MENAKEYVNLTCKWLLILWSIYILYDGVIYYLATMGAVSGTEFTMLITLVAIGAKFLIWFSLAGLWLATLPIPVPVVPAKPVSRKKINAK